MRRWIVAIAGLGLACARAESPNAIDAQAQQGTHDAARQVDAHDVGPRDAILPIDAPVSMPIDAAGPPPVDAAVPDGAIFCSDNSQCTDVGTCCFLIGSDFGFCADGTVVFGVCFPTASGS
jgi:hypothetical protein